MASPWGRGALPSSAWCWVAVPAAEATPRDHRRGWMRHRAPRGAPCAGCGLWISRERSRCRLPSPASPVTHHCLGLF